MVNKTGYQLLRANFIGLSNKIRKQSKKCNRLKLQKNKMELEKYMNLIVRAHCDKESYRPYARSYHLILNFLRGVPYLSVEKNARARINYYQVEKLVENYTINPTKFMENFKAWVCEDGAATSSSEVAA